MHVHMYLVEVLFFFWIDLSMNLFNKVLGVISFLYYVFIIFQYNPDDLEVLI